MVPAVPLSRPPDSLDRIALAKRLGFGALVVTVDAPVSGNRERDVRNGLSVPVRVRPRMALEAMLRPRWLAGYLTGPPLISHHDQDASLRPGGVTGGERLTASCRGCSTPTSAGTTCAGSARPGAGRWCSRA